MDTNLKNINNNKRNENIEETEIEVNNCPFRRSSVMARSPPTNTAQPCVVNNDKRGNSSMKKLGDKISQLVEFIKPRSNIHKEIHSLTRQIQALYLQTSDELNNLDSDKTEHIKSVEQMLVSTQTQTDDLVWPKLSQAGTPKRKRDTTASSPRDNNPKKKKDIVLRGTAKPTTSGNTMAEKANDGANNTDWVKVRPKAKNKKKQGNSSKKRKPARPDALVIHTCGDTSYADILKQVKSDPKLDVLGQNVNNIRKTAKGELLLELNKPAHESTSEFRHKIEEVLGTTVEVRTLTHEINLEIRDIDEVTDKQDVLAALSNLSDEFKVLHVSAIKSLRKAYGGTQTATIGLGAGLANRLLEIGKIRIGWVRCRIREKLSPRRCFKCLDFGHSAFNCQSQYDHTGKCLRCGEFGHKIGACTNNPVCLLCSNEATNGNSNHTTGCTVCPYYQKALQSLKTGK